MQWVNHRHSERKSTNLGVHHQFQDLQDLISEQALPPHRALVTNIHRVLGPTNRHATLCSPPPRTPSHTTPTYLALSVCSTADAVVEETQLMYDEAEALELGERLGIRLHQQCHAPQAHQLAPGVVLDGILLAQAANEGCWVVHG